jgi:hypothetical protein
MKHIGMVSLFVNISTAYSKQFMSFEYKYSLILSKILLEIPQHIWQLEKTYRKSKNDIKIKVTKFKIRTPIIDHL